MSVIVDETKRWLVSTLLLIILYNVPIEVLAYSTSTDILQAGNTLREFSYRVQIAVPSNWECEFDGNGDRFGQPRYTNIQVQHHIMKRICIAHIKYIKLLCIRTKFLLRFVLTLTTFALR